MENTTKKIVPIALVLFFIVFIIGYTLFSRLSPTLAPAPNYVPPQTPPPIAASPSLSPAVKRPSAEDLRVLVFPGPNATPSEQKQHNDLVSRLAEMADVLNIRDCFPDPLVMKVLLKNTVKIYNPNATSHTIVRGSAKITVAGGETKTVKASGLFSQGAGNYGYTCDGSPNVVGVFLVMP